MIGGTVEKIYVLEDKVWIRVREVGFRSRNCTTEGCEYHTCAIHVVRNEKSESIEIGDALWWQSGSAYWTPKANIKPVCDHEHHFSCSKEGVDFDIQIERVGYSGVSEPQGIQ